MATTIEAAGDKLKIDTAFVSGKHRVSVNGAVAFEGTFKTGEPKQFMAGHRDYVIERRVLSKSTKAKAFHVQISEQGQLVFTGIFDQMGKPVTSEAQAAKTGAIQACGGVFAVIGVGTMIGLNLATGVVPGGAVGGAIGAGVGYGIGYGIGTLIFGSRE